MVSDWGVVVLYLGWRHGRSLLVGVGGGGYFLGNDGRRDEIRPINFELNVAPHASGSVLVSMGKTRVICGVMIEELAALDERTGRDRWLAYRGIFDAAVLDAAA